MDKGADKSTTAGCAPSSRTVDGVVLPWHIFKRDCVYQVLHVTNDGTPIRFCKWPKRTCNYCRIGEHNCPRRQNKTIADNTDLGGK